MNWDNGLPGMVNVLAIRMINPWPSRVLICLIGFLVVLSIIGTNREILPSLMKVLKKIVFVLSMCTVAFFIAACAVGLTCESMDNVALSAKFLKLCHGTWVSLCVTCVVACLLFLAWAVHAMSRWFAYPTNTWVAPGFGEEEQKDDAKEGEDQEE